MIYQLLLVDGDGDATTARLRIRTLREFPGHPALSVHFRPVRQDLLFESAKIGGQLAYRILFGEGVARNQLWVEYEVLGEHANVSGRSSDLLFALTLITATWIREPAPYAVIAATGVLNAEGGILSVNHTPEKILAAADELALLGPAVVFYPMADVGAVESWRKTHPLPPNVRLQPVGHLEEALTCLGYTLQKVYLQNPFRGLQHFDYEHHAIFFGRDGEIREVLKQLLQREDASRPGLLIEGPSGSGKSSFLRAGVLPALADTRNQPETVRALIGYRPFTRSINRAIWRPGMLRRRADEKDIAQSVWDCWAALPELQGRLGSEPCVSLVELTQRRAQAWVDSKRFVWLIDQFEELFVLGLDDATIDAFGKFLGQLQAVSAWTLACVRSDAMPELKKHSSLREVFGTDGGQYYLATLTGTKLDEVIALPARAADLVFGVDPEGRPLDQLLRDEAYREQDSLPLLQFTLNELYQRRSGKELTYAAYRQLGGLTGSIATTAQTVLESDDAQSQRALPLLFRSLVRVNESGRATRRYAAMSEFDGHTRQGKLVQRLVAARLCATDERDGEAVVAFAHDSLLRTLPPLVKWLKQEAGLLQTRELAQRETRLWGEHGESDDWLAGADKLIALKTLNAADVALPEPVRRYIQRSEQRVRRMIRIKRMAVGTIAILAVVASIGAWIATTKQHDAEHQTALTIEAQKRSLTEAAADRLKDGDLPYARGIIIQVLKNLDFSHTPDPNAVNVFQDVRAHDPLRVVLAGHDGAVRNVAYSPDGARIVTGSLDGTARIWDTRTGIQLAVLLRVAKRAVMYVCYSPDGRRIATSAAGVVTLFDAQTFAKLHSLSDSALPVGSGAFSPDSTRIVTYLGDMVRIWDVSTGKAIFTFPNQSKDVFFTAYSPDGKRILAATDDNTVRILDARSGAQLAVLKGHTASAGLAAYSPDGRRIITGSMDGTARIWDARTGVQLHVLSANVAQVWGVAFSPDGGTVATGSTDHTVRFWDANTGAPLSALRGHGNIIGGIAYSPDGLHLASASYDQTARIWDLHPASASHVLTIGGRPINANDVSYSSDGELMVTPSDGNNTRVWDAHSETPLRILTGPGGNIGSAAFSHDGNRIVTTSDDNTVRIWDAHSGALVRALPAQDHPVCASFSPNDQRVVAGIEDLTVAVWDVRSGVSLGIWSGHHDYVTSTRFSPDGTRILTTSVDKTARIWDAHSGAQLGILKHDDFMYSGEYSADGKRILTSSLDQTARIWDASTGAQQITLTGPRTPLFSAAFSADGRHVVTGGKDRMVRIWDAHSGTQLATLTGSTGERVLKVAYSPDELHIASLSSDQTVRIWDARIFSGLPSQILWAEAADPDGLSEVQLRGLGLSLAAPKVEHLIPATRCEEQAAAYYDPDRHAVGMTQNTINADIAAMSCASPPAEPAKIAQWHYLSGRALLAKSDSDGARSRFESAISEGYRAAYIDLADLLADPAIGVHDGLHAVSLYEQAWERHVPIAAYRLGRLYESGIPDTKAVGKYLLASDASKAWIWYQKGADAGEPTALGRLAQREEGAALEHQGHQVNYTNLLGAFGLYARAAEHAHAESWPDEAWEAWRYRRATLARVLALNNMMQQVADEYKAARDEVTPRPRTFLESVFGHAD